MAEDKSTLYLSDNKSEKKTEGRNRRGKQIIKKYLKCQYQCINERKRNDIKKDRDKVMQLKQNKTLLYERKSYQQEGEKMHKDKPTT